MKLLTTKSHADIAGKALANARGLGSGVDAKELEEKLKNLLSSSDIRHSSSPSESGPSSPDSQIEAIRAERRADNLRDYGYLTERGGRPAFPLEVAQANININHFGEHEVMIEYWGQSYLGQRNRWVAFLNHQKRSRRTMEIFTEYQQTVYDYREKEGIEGSIHLNFDEKKQSKIDTWKEYHYHQHKVVPHKREKAEAGRKRREQRIIDWEAGKRDPTIPEDMGWIHHVPTLDESRLDKYMSWIRWIEAELRQIEQECAEPANNGIDNASHLTGKGDERMESSSLRSSHAETAPPSAEKFLRKSERSVGGLEKSPAAIGVIGSPLVSSRRVVNPDVAAKHPSQEDLRTTSLAPPDQSGKSIGQAREKIGSSSTRKIRSRSLAETGSLRRSQRIIDMESKKAQQQVTLETTKLGLMAPTQTESRTQSKKKKSKPAHPHSRPEGVTKPQASRKGKLKLSRTVKHDAIATALRDVEQQATQKTSKASTTAPKADTRRERRTQPKKSNSKPSSQSRPQGIIKSQARSKGKGRRPPRAAKINALAREVVL
ncbi:hypothetical protein HCBG_07207 [Histoplasma capsulatum G186AR]|uniref:Uncharacterized protein n=1 Tax=Ajellomyces capsulatus (strain G186AR / H82 / ATCC MYA-2454 / RMSCC 2432) TaxID=447093 RepID=C0NVM7_AJECG|nr:uncharacterized protein HCBG_07207 [Histoplasma capsulatum G186AR]EEH04566.1 hypothetical protein HCBG_07207 [Histoplasma capsulatum G186AR]